MSTLNFTIERTGCRSETASNFSKGSGIISATGMFEREREREREREESEFLMTKCHQAGSEQRKNCD